MNNNNLFNPPSLYALPTEVLLIIIEYLEFKNQLELIFVCKKFKEPVEKIWERQNVILRFISENIHRRTIESIQNLSPKYLLFSKCKLMTSIDLRKCTNLKRLIFEDSKVGTYRLRDFESHILLPSQLNDLKAHVSHAFNTQSNQPLYDISVNAGLCVNLKEIKLTSNDPLQKFRLCPPAVPCLRTLICNTVFCFQCTGLCLKTWLSGLEKLSARYWWVDCTKCNFKSFPPSGRNSDGSLPSLDLLTIPKLRELEIVEVRDDFQLEMPNPGKVQKIVTVTLVPQNKPEDKRSREICFPPEFKKTIIQKFYKPKKKLNKLKKYFLKKK